MSEPQASIKHLYRGYTIRAGALGYSVHKDETCVAAGGAFPCSKRANLQEARRTVDALIAGTRKPLG